MYRNLYARWLTWWEAVGADGAPDWTFVDLLERYAEPHRSYHTMSHIAHCLRQLTLVRRLARNPLAVEKALWYHDAFYDTRAKDNEEKSGELAFQTALDVGLSKEFAAEVRRLIIVGTKHHELPKDVDAQLVSDIDLSSLGLPWGEFLSYSERIRSEYAWVPEDEFKARRKEILLGLIERGRIFATSFFYEEYETIAKNNIISLVASS